MIEKVKKAITNAIYAEFGEEYNVYTEEVEQDLQESCFFVSSLKAENTLFLKNRYFRSQPFCVQYVPRSDEPRTECEVVRERLYNCLEWIDDEGDLIRGEKMSGEISDGILSFFVNYDLFVYKPSENEPMEAMSENISVKG